MELGFLFLGVLLGWLTKVPWMLKFYQEQQEEWQHHKDFCNKVTNYFEEQKRNEKEVH